MKLMIKHDSGLDEDVLIKIRKVFTSFPEVEEVIIFGSRANGNFKPGSDIDLALKGDNITHNILSRINLMLDDLLLPYIIETTLFNHIDNDDLIGHINRAGKIFYKKPFLVQTT